MLHDMAEARFERLETVRARQQGHGFLILDIWPQGLGVVVKERRKGRERKVGKKGSVRTLREMVKEIGVESNSIRE